MVKIAYKKPKNWQVSTRVYVDHIIKVVDEYESQGYRLSLRQLYYQLVSRNFIKNIDREYPRLSRILAEARLGGIIDWDIIEDRMRIPRIPSQFDGVLDLLQVAVDSYRRDRWKDQKNYVEVWVEKDALSGVLETITGKYHCHLLVNRGYSSVSAMHDASIRIRNAESNGKICYVLYLGDLDPSGEDMVRDIEKRLLIFGCNVKIEKIALTKKQVEKYNPPPNPTKMSDPRSKDYVALHGNESWEVDALRPDVLNKLLEKRIKQLCDLKKYEKVVKLENKEKRKLKKLRDEYEFE